MQFIGVGTTLHHIVNEGKPNREEEYKIWSNQFSEMWTIDQSGLHGEQNGTWTGFRMCGAV